MGESLINPSWSKLEPDFLNSGFIAAGCVDYDLAQTHYQEHAKRYDDWISRGFHGAMEYLSRGRDRRLNPKLVFPELQSIIAVLKPYSPHPVGNESIRYARYLNGEDYHEVLVRDLEKVIQGARVKNLVPQDFKYKIAVDTSAVLERTWAALTGLGWIGKNTLLIHPQFGSYTFIGVIFTNVKFNREPILLKDYCGSCTRCLSACPTQALEPHDLNARKCISYLTLEKRGSWEEKLPTAKFVAGCDICQEVCPFNTKPVKQMPIDLIAPHLNLDAVFLENETEVEYRARVKGTALSRVKFLDFKRNLNATKS